jgi:hypothetical protein
MTRAKKSSQSQNFNNNVIAGSQIGQSSGDIQQTYTTQVAGNGKPLDPKDIIKLVEDIHRLLKNSDLPDDQKTKCDRHLKTLKDEVGEKDPDKDYAAQTLQKVVHVLKEAGKVTVSTMSLMNRVQPMITRIVPWLGEARNFLKL